MKITSASTSKTSARQVPSAKAIKVTKGALEENKVSLSTSPQELSPEFLPDLATVSVTDTMVVCSFDNGHTVSFPLQWSAKLSQATTSQRQAFEVNAHFIFWDDIDEIISVRNILLGKQLAWK